MEKHRKIKMPLKRSYNPKSLFYKDLRKWSLLQVFPKENTRILRTFLLIKRFREEE
jgi:hypothetical protein